MIELDKTETSQLGLRGTLETVFTKVRSKNVKPVQKQLKDRHRFYGVIQVAGNKTPSQRTHPTTPPPKEKNMQLT